jgi:hypothetical protein
MFLRRNTYAVRPSLCVGISLQLNSLNQGHCEGLPSLGLGTRMIKNLKIKNLQINLVPRAFV